MNIAMFTDAYFPRINGVAVSVNSYALALTKLGHTVCVVCLEYTEEQQRNALFDEKARDKDSPFQVVRVPSSMLPFSKEDRAARLYKWHFIKKSMDAFRPDVVHINSEAVLGYFGVLYSRHRKIPYVFTFHTMWEDYLAHYVPFVNDKSVHFITRKVMRFYLKHASVIITPTKRIAEVVSDYGIEKQPYILPTGIPDSREKYSIFRAQTISSSLGRKFPAIKGKKILLYVGRIVKEKNLSFLFDVLTTVQATIPKTALLLVGGGPYQEALEAISRERGLEKAVFFTGYVRPDDLMYLYRLAQVFVFPSKTETQGLVTVEAMLAGLPVVAIGEMGTVDVMQGDNGGFMVDDDVNVFSAKVIDLLKNQALRKQKAEEAKKWGERWKIASLTPRLLDCYTTAITTYHTAKNAVAETAGGEREQEA